MYWAISWGVLKYTHFSCWCALEPHCVRSLGLVWGDCVDIKIPLLLRQRQVLRIGIRKTLTLYHWWRKWTAPIVILKPPVLFLALSWLLFLRLGSNYCKHYTYKEYYSKYVYHILYFSFVGKYRELFWEMQVRKEIFAILGAFRRKSPRNSCQLPRTRYWAYQD